MLLFSDLLQLLATSAAAITTTVMTHVMIHSQLEPLKLKYPELSYSDLWTLAGTTAIEVMGGPSIKYVRKNKSLTVKYETDKHFLIT
jgi:Peroxidase